MNVVAGPKITQNGPMIHKKHGGGEHKPVFYHQTHM